MVWKTRKKGSEKRSIRNVSGKRKPLSCRLKISHWHRQSVLKLFHLPKLAQRKKNSPRRSAEVATLRIKTKMLCQRTIKGRGNKFLVPCPPPSFSNAPLLSVRQLEHWPGWTHPPEVRHEKRAQTQLLFRWGRGLPHEGVGAKKFGMFLETREIKLFWRGVLGFCWDIPVVPKKVWEKKKGRGSIFKRTRKGYVMELTPPPFSVDQLLEASNDQFQLGAPLSRGNSTGRIPKAPSPELWWMWRGLLGNAALWVRQTSPEFAWRGAHASDSHPGEPARLRGHTTDNPHQNEEFYGHVQTPWRRYPQKKRKTWGIP